MPTEDRARVRLLVEGFVQGVGFRAFVIREARGLGVVGFVRNVMDGRVEIVAEGSREDLVALSDAAERGPSMSRVDCVDLEWGVSTGEFQAFDVAYSSRRY